MKIGLSYDIKERTSKAEGLPEDAFEEYDSPETVEALAVAISSHGHTVQRLGGGPAFLKNIQDTRPDLVFNIAEGLVTIAAVKRRPLQCLKCWASPIPAPTR